MMCIAVILLAVTLSVESYGVSDQRLAHGRQLRIFLPKGSEKLEFTPADEPRKMVRYWEKGRIGMRKGRLSASGNDWHWYIDQVTYEDQGTYILRNFFNKNISTVRVAITPREVYKKCVAGESLYISLEGIQLEKSLLSFSGHAANVTLVRNGSKVTQKLPKYVGRVRTTASNIEVRNVNYSDVGHYTLKDQKQRVVSVTRMDLTVHHKQNKDSPLLALLLLLLSIPIWIYYYRRKKIVRRRASAATQLQAVPNTTPPPPAGPVGPCPQYNAYYQGPDATMGPTVHPPPPTTGPVQWSGPMPSAAYPPYPPGPAAIPPGQPPQWNGQYPAGPVPPMGYAPAPVMYSSPPPPAAAGEPYKEEVRVEAAASSPAMPLLNAAPQAEAASPPGAPLPPSSNNVLASSDATY
ncbi:uncharacterized protein LOC114851743 isoform X2 [Betta splendens]|nr:uncharacterized protein LOC114851743 isoform X2 [Betta splendens]XP_055366214.1 uncharacterized protein LOC114851743 isoform X2 [Betta splendens]XP_055366215.1 uncharacterized protein LOC114851743 isoform X2 [Betta splendens]